MNRQIYSLLVILAVGLRALIPAGFMVAPANADAASFIVICTGHGPETLALDKDGNPVAPKPQTDSAICPFATAAAVASALSLPKLTAPEALVASATMLPPERAVRWQNTELRPPPRAPPAIS